MKKVLLMILIVTLSIVPIFAEVKQNKGTGIITVAPATQTTVNGKVSDDTITNRAITLGPFFKSYSGTNSTIAFFKLIGSSYNDNRNSTTPFVINYLISSSASQGSEFSGSITLSGEMKASVVAKIGASVQGGCTLTKSTNSAVGISGTMTVPAKKQGRLEAYYAGISSGGTLYYYTDTDGVITNKSTPLTAKVHLVPNTVNFKSVVY